MRSAVPHVLVGLSGLIAVAMGAAGAHAVSSPHVASMVQQAALYQLIHTVAILFILNQSGKQAALTALCFALGILIFSGGLYVRYVAGINLPSGLIPFGGMCYMAGWFTYAIGSLPIPSKR